MKNKMIIACFMVLLYLSTMFSITITQIIMQNNVNATTAYQQKNSDNMNCSMYLDYSYEIYNADRAKSRKVRKKML